MQYKLLNYGISGIIKIEDDGTIRCVPEDTNNADWQAYQAWLAEVDELGNPINAPLPVE